MRTERPPAGGRCGRDHDRPLAPAVHHPEQPAFEPAPAAEPQAPAPSPDLRGAALLNSRELPGHRSFLRLGDAARDDDTVPRPRRGSDGVQLDQEDLRLLALLAEGMPVSSIARRVAMSDRTIRRRVRAICEQLGMKATVQAIVWAARRGLI